MPHFDHSEQISKILVDSIDRERVVFSKSVAPRQSAASLGVGKMLSKIMNNSRSASRRREGPTRRTPQPTTMGQGGNTSGY